MQITNKENKTLGFVREWNMLKMNLNSTKKNKEMLFLFVVVFTCIHESIISRVSCADVFMEHEFYAVTANGKRMWDDQT